MTTVRTAAAALATVVLVAGLGACGGSDTSSGAASEPAQGAPSTQSDTQADEQEADGGDSPVGGVTFVDTVDDPAATITIGPDGFDAADTAISVGDVVELTAGEGGPYSVIVGDLDGYTVSRGLDEFFSFTQPGTYDVREDVSGATATITVD